MAMVGGILAALIIGKNDPGFIHNGPLAGLVAVCAGSDVFHPLGRGSGNRASGWRHFCLAVGLVLNPKKLTIF